MRNIAQQNQPKKIRGSYRLQDGFLVRRPLNEKHIDILADKAALKCAIRELKSVLSDEKKLHPAILYRLSSALNSIRSRSNLAWSIGVVFHSVKMLEEYFVERKEGVKVDHHSEKILFEITKVLWARQGEIAELYKENLNEKTKNNLRGIGCMLDSIVYKVGIEPKPK
ncbi:MAG: hypothetical protein QXT25_03995 [Candidatus Anstonellaceae archaeon]